MKRSSNRRSTARERELEERIKALEEKLANSVPKIDFETVKSRLELEINDLRMRLSNSTPETGMENESGGMSAAEIKEPTPELPKSPTESESHWESRVEELQQALSESKREADALREKISAMESPREDTTTENSQEPKITYSEDDEDSEEPESAESRTE